MNDVRETRVERFIDLVCGSRTRPKDRIADTDSRVFIASDRKTCLQTPSVHKFFCNAATSHRCVIARSKRDASRFEMSLKFALHEK
jgi:hypothetical protein